jgi:hypothetical protein
VHDYDRDAERPRRRPDGTRQDELEGTAALTLRGSVQGCEKTGANITASPPPEMKRVPWTGSGDENGLKGKITFPASAAIAPGTSWAFAVDSP